MGDKSKIEWTDATWNPVTGCTKISPGCKHCYAETWANRHLGEFAKDHDRKFTHILMHPEKLDIPLRWRKPRKIFVNSMSDLFHEALPFGFLVNIFHQMRLCPQHTFMILTKRADRMLDWVPRIMAKLNRNEPWPNVWLGVSVENQQTARQRIPQLLETPAAVRWISAEPLLQNIDLSYWIPPSNTSVKKCSWCGGWLNHPHDCYEPQEFIDWVVAGGESGTEARPMHQDWARSLRDQCQAAGVSFFFKQWGEWRPRLVGEKTIAGVQWYDGMAKVGKKSAGRMLDGRTWDELPNSIL